MVDVTYDAGRPWRRHPRVAIRPEPFGALAYHYLSRRLTFLRDPDLVAVVEALADHPHPDAALDAVGVDPRRRPAFHRALGALAASGFIEPVEGGTTGAGVPQRAAS